MKQVLQSYRTGKLEVANVPPPAVLPGTVLVRTTASLISAGTEKMVIDLARKSLAGKARERPDLVKKVVDKISKDGVVATAQTVLNKLDMPIPLGYSSAGEVIDVGPGVTHFRRGDRVACAGAKYANHAEINAVPANLCAKVPGNVSDEAASFGTVAAIALHGLRSASTSLGECVGVIGLGVIGQLALQFARAQGARTIGIDLDPAKVELARKCGATVAVRRDDDVARAVSALTGGRGLDAVLICAATDSSDPVELAAELSRDRGRIVAVGAVGLNLPRRPFYEKEIEFIVSRSYGPGRYDPRYEEEGVDYPIGYVRWTAGRNLDAYLGQVADSRIDVAPLISHRFEIGRADEAYDLVTAGTEPFLGVVLTYPESIQSSSVAIGAKRSPFGMIQDASRLLRSNGSRVGVGVAGAGNFASAVLVPAFASAGARLQNITSARGITSRHLAEKHGFSRCSSEFSAVLADRDVDAVVIATRHDLHAGQVIAALRAGKHVFVEKPLALTVEQLGDVRREARGSDRVVMVGFNRRYAPLTQKLMGALRSRRGPFVFQYRINAGAIPADSWIHDPKQGGGRIVGEVCHFIDLVSVLADAIPVRVYTAGVRNSVPPTRDDDQVVISIELSDGSLASITYASGGDPSFPKERLEVIGGGLNAVLEDFRILRIRADGKSERESVFEQQDKGHVGEARVFLSACAAGKSTEDFDASVVASLATFAAVESLHTGLPVRVETLSERLIADE